MKDFKELFAGDDLRSLGKSSEIVSLINNQKSFDKLFAYLYNNDRAIVMKTIDLIEKITLVHKEYLQKHKLEIFNMSNDAGNIELKWHLAQIIIRIKYTKVKLKLYGKYWKNGFWTRRKVKLSG